MKNYLILLLAFTLASLRIPTIAKAACPSLVNGGDITILDSDNCSLTTGNTYIDKVTSEASSTNTGTLTINSGGALTIVNGSTLHTSSFTVNSGGILYIQNGGSISISGSNAPGIWVDDSDADGWAGNLNTTYSATAAGRRRVGLMRSGSTTDCNDSNYSLNNVACIIATGGTITTISGYKVHRFTTSSTFTISSGTDDVEYLVVAGGGSGGRSTDTASGGGGGAGGMRTGTLSSMSTGSYTVTIGAAGTATGGIGGSGGNSVFSTITSTGGGGGGYREGGSTGASGGSGGGGALNTNGSSGGTGTVGQGNNGGAGNRFYPGNGGGAGSAGGIGNGGAGLASSITGSSVTYAAGGPYCTSNQAANTGNGGCSNYSANHWGHNGSSGVVVVRYSWE